MVYERLAHHHTPVFTVNELRHVVEAEWAAVAGHVIQSVKDSGYTILRFYDSGDAILRFCRFSTMSSRITTAIATTG